MRYYRKPNVGNVAIPVVGLMPKRWQRGGSD